MEIKNIKLIKLRATGVRTHDIKEIQNEETGETETWKKELVQPRLLLEVQISIESYGLHLNDILRCEHGNLYMITSSETIKKTKTKGDKRRYFLRNVMMGYDCFSMPAKFQLLRSTQKA
jgi:hypothetical protein